MAGKGKKTYLVVTANGDWQELGEVGDGATIWELSADIASRLEEDPGSLAELLEDRGTAVVDLYTEPPEGNLKILGDVDSFIERF